MLSVLILRCLQVSSKSGAGVPAAVAAIRRERRGRDVYVMGAANVGKSAFIRALVRCALRFACIGLLLRPLHFKAPVVLWIQACVQPCCAPLLI